ncbi:MAG: hypothetical protein ACPGEF_04875, partial [Endozoicomonas sp.]
SRSPSVLIDLAASRANASSAFLSMVLILAIVGCDDKQLHSFIYSLVVNHGKCQSRRACASQSTLRVPYR